MPKILKQIKIIEPHSNLEYEKYYNLRFNVLRKPWGQPLGSEKDNEEKTSIHRMIINKKSGEALAVGRLDFNIPYEAQIRYMAVTDKFQGKGIGSILISSLEGIAIDMGYIKMVLQARENAIQFYKNNGYQIIKKTHLLFNEIQHWLMSKYLDL